MSQSFFSGVTTTQAYTACTPLDLSNHGDSELSLYASGPHSGTWSATVNFWELRGDGELSLIATANLTQSGPYTGGTGSRVYDQKSVWINAGSLS